MNEEIKNLNDKLFIMLFNQFKLKLRLKNKQTNKTHLLKKIKKDIARIKTLISYNNKKN